jgi:hypothetical protein
MTLHWDLPSDTRVKFGLIFCVAAIIGLLCLRWSRINYMSFGTASYKRPTTPPRRSHPTAFSEEPAPTVGVDVKEKVKEILLETLNSVDNPHYTFEVEQDNGVNVNVIHVNGE